MGVWLGSSLPSAKPESSPAWWVVCGWAGLGLFVVQAQLCLNGCGLRRPGWPPCLQQPSYSQGDSFFFCQVLFSGSDGWPISAHIGSWGIQICGPGWGWGMAKMNKVQAKYCSLSGTIRYTQELKINMVAVMTNDDP